MKKDIVNINQIDINTIIPSRIREARVARGLSLTELSERIGVTSQAISQYELGTSKPSSLIFMKLVNELQFPSTFFYKTISTNSSLSSGATYFRSNKNISKKVKDALKIRLNWIDNVNSFISNYLNLPNLNLPDLSDMLDDEEFDKVKIEEIALRVRKFWGIGDGPVLNLVNILQKNGFIISKISFNNKKVDAFSRWYNGKPYIMLGKDKNSAVRSRFDLAHELGHLIMHRNINQEDLSKKEILNRIESEADMFAASFLLPVNSFNKEVISSSINQFIILKKRWKVSISAMIKKCQDWDVLTDNQIRYLKSQMIKNGYYKKEPLDDEIAEEVPYLFKQCFNLLIDNKLINKQQLLDEIALNSDEAETLFSLDKGYFSCDNEPINLVCIK